MSDLYIYVFPDPQIDDPSELNQYLNRLDQEDNCPGCTPKQNEALESFVGALAEEFPLPDVEAWEEVIDDSYWHRMHMLLTVLSLWFLLAKNMATFSKRVLSLPSHGIFGFGNRMEGVFMLPKIFSSLKKDLNAQNGKTSNSNTFNSLSIS